MMNDAPPATTIEQLLAGKFATAEEVAEGDNPIRDGWVLHTLADAYLERPPIVEIVAQVITEGSLNIWYGAPGSKKSLILADLCACVVAGQRWLAHLPTVATAQESFPTIQGRALWLDFDNGSRRTHDRFAAFGRAYNLAPDAALNYASMPTPWLDVSKRPMVEALAKIIEHSATTLLVVDNLGVTIGDTEENTAEMAPIMSNLRWLCNSTGVAINYVHHQRKGSNGNETTAGKAEALRGHSSILASLDMAFHVAAVEGERSIIITPAKQRDADSFDYLSALFTYEHKPETRTLHTARFFGIDGDDKGDQELRTIRNAILSIVEQVPGISQQDLVVQTRDSLALNHTPPGVNKVRGIIRELVEDGSIMVRTGERTSNAVRMGHYKR